MSEASRRSRTYQAGEWYGVVGPHVLVVLPPQEKHRVAAIWALADEGAGFDETLDVLISGGLRDLSGFVLVSSSEGDTKVVIRGAATARFTAGGEIVELRGSEATTWVERSLHDVESMVVEVGEAPAGTPSYAMEHGLVRVSRLTEGTPPTDEAGSGADLSDEDEDGGVSAGPSYSAGLVAVPSGPATVDDDGDDPLAESLADLLPPPEVLLTAVPDARPDGQSEDAEADDEVEPEDDADPEPVAGDGPLAVTEEAEAWADPLVDPREVPLDQPGDDAADVDAWIDPAGSPDPLEPAGPAEIEDLGVATEEDLGPDQDDDLETGLMPAVTEGAAEDAPIDDLGPTEAFVPADVTPDEADGPWGGDHDGATRFSPFESEDYELARPGIAGQEPAPAITSRPVARLLLSSGETIDVDRVVVLGRAPVARRYADDEHPLLVTVPSPHQEISSTHVEVRPGSGADHGTAVVTDLGSTNGTVVVQPGLEPDELQPGVSVQLIPGALIDLGDGVTISVTRP